MSNEKLDNTMRKINAMLARADHPNTPAPEADACRAKAEKWMQQYRIEESELIASGALHMETITPIKKTMDVSPSASPYYNTYYNLALYAANHAGVRWTYDWTYVDGVHTLAFTLVGYESDIRYVEALFLSARIVFADRMEPKYDSSLSDEDNVYRMRNAGLERGRIGQLMGWGGEGTQGPNKVTRVYKRACKQRGEEATVVGRDFNVKTFREEYANGFATEFWNALWKAKRDSGESGAMVLAGREEAVNEAFYTHFPNMRPKAAIGKEGSQPYVDTRTDKQKAADERRMEREAMARARKAYSPAGRAGTRAGKAAAREVNVGGEKPKPRIN